MIEPFIQGETEFLEDEKNILDKTSTDLSFFKQGGFGSVYFIDYHFRNFNQIAVKKLRKKEANLLNFLREVTITNKIRHPCTIELVAFNIVKQKDNGKFVISPFIATPFYPRGSLKEMLRSPANTNHQSPYEELGNMRRSRQGSHLKMKVDDGTKYSIILYGIARALKFMHHLSFFHRDIKPDNIFIDENNYPHLGDYGLSRQNEDCEEQSKKVGTSTYMAPEIINGDHFYSYPADIYSLGLVFYALTEGSNLQSPPKQNEFSILPRFSSSYHSERLQFSITPPPLQRLILGMIRYCPFDRPTIQRVCSLLEDEQYWFPKTKHDEFAKYKKMIDDYEMKRMKLLNGANITYQNDSLIANNILLHQFIGQEKLMKFQAFWSLFEVAALKGDAHAKFLLGTIYFFGSPEIPKNLVLALRYFQESQDSEYEAIQYLMMVRRERDQSDYIYRHKHKIEQSDANFLCPEAQYLNGIIQEAKGEILKAIKYYTLSAKNGLLKAKARLGIFLLKYAPHMIDTVERLLTDATAESNRCLIDKDERKIAMFFLAVIYYKKKQYNKALTLLMELLDADYPDAAYFIAILYHGKNDLPNAIKYFGIAGNEFGNKAALQIYNDLSNNTNASSYYTYEYDYSYMSGFRQ